jgi:hypothetical protein
MRAPLICKEVRGDLVALMRDELSPLRVESVRTHLTVCHECREQALELELGARSYGKLPELQPPVDLITLTLRRVRERQAREEARANASREGAVIPHRVVPVQIEAPPKPEQRVAQTSVLFRPIENRFARLAVAALFLAMAIAFSVPSIAEALGRAGQRLMGSQLSEKLDEATQSFLMRFFL